MDAFFLVIVGIVAIFFTGMGTGKMLDYKVVKNTFTVTSINKHPNGCTLSFKEINNRLLTDCGKYNVGDILIMEKK